MFNKGKGLSKLMNSEFFIQAGIDTIKQFLHSFDPNRTLGSITDKEIDSFVRQSINKKLKK